MKKYLVASIGAAIIALVTGTTVFAQGLGNISTIEKPVVSRKAKQTIEQSKEITPNLRPVLNLSKKLTLKPVIISEVKLVSDPPKVTAETPKPQMETKENEDEKYDRLTGYVFKGSGSTLAYVLVTDKGVVVLGGSIDILTVMNNSKVTTIKGKYETKKINTEYGVLEVKIFNVISAE